MKLSIDHLSSIVGWEVTSPSTIVTTDATDFIAGLNSTSLMIHFSDGSGDNDTEIADSIDTDQWVLLGDGVIPAVNSVWSILGGDGVATEYGILLAGGTEYRRAIKTLATPIDVSDYESLVFSIWSKTKRHANYSRPVDFSYIIKLNDTDVFYIPIKYVFSDITIPIDNVTSISKIEIIPLHTDDDYIVISEMLVEHEELPLDILLETKTYIEYMLNDNLGSGKLIGTASGTVGAKTLSLTGDFLEHYTVIKIDDGVNSETHQLRGGRSTWTFMPTFDGDSLLYSYTNANVYLTYPVTINPDEQNICIPGITLWTMVPVPILRTGRVEMRLEGFNYDGTFVERREGQILEFKLLIDCEARQSELIDIMTRQIRRMLSQNKLWVNGRKHYIDFYDSPTEIRPKNGIDIIPKVQYTMKIEAVENIYDRTTLQTTLSVNPYINVYLTLP